MKALELIKQIKNVDENPYHKTRTIIFNRDDMAFIKEAIAELEALQQPKSCAKCKAFKLDDEHNDGFGQCFWGIHFPNRTSSSYHKGTDFYCREFEAKEQ